MLSITVDVKYTALDSVKCTPFGRRYNYSMEQIESYRDLATIHGLFNQVQLDPSRTCVYWNDEIDLPSDTLYEYGKSIAS